MTRSSWKQVIAFNASYLHTKFNLAKNTFNLLDKQFLFLILKTLTEFLWQNFQAKLSHFYMKYTNFSSMNILLFVSYPKC